MNCIKLFIANVVILVLPALSFAQTDTTFTYQGSLRESGAAANGSFNMDFSLLDALSGGSQVGSTVSVNGQGVADGLFSVELDFGANAFDGSQRWLEIVVEGTTLTPRQAMTRSPYSIQTRGIFVDADENIGIGTTNPASKLHLASGQLAIDVGGTTAFFGNFGNPGGNLFGFSKPGVPLLAIDVATGSVGIGTGLGPISGALNVESVGSIAFYGRDTATTGFSFGVLGETLSNSGAGVDGYASSTTGANAGVRGRSDSNSGFDFFAAGQGTDYGSSSSRRWKSDIRNIDHPLDKISRLRGVYYTWDEEHGGQHDLGMIAEEVGQVLPEIVNYEENGIDAIGMDYGKMTPLLVEAVNALRAENEALHAEKNAQIASLQADNSVLRAQLDRLEQLITKLAPIHQEEGTK